MWAWWCICWRRRMSICCSGGFWGSWSSWTHNNSLRSESGFFQCSYWTFSSLTIVIDSSWNLFKEEGEERWTMNDKAK
jgi:hypothetical protein